MALGYILGKGSAKLAKVKLNIPLVLVLSVIPDADILLQHIDGLSTLIPHRGPFHSVVLSSIIFIPIFAYYRKSAAPYFVALIQHALIGDFFIGGQLELLWPISQQKFGFPIYISITSIQNVSLELSLFIVSLILLVATKDILSLFRPNKSNLILAIPIFTVLLPTLMSYPLNVPVLMIPPHVVYTLIFAGSILIELWAVLNPKRTIKSEIGKK